MAQAVQDIFKEVRVSYRTAIEDGFYYDFDRVDSFTPEDLGKIEARMGEIIARDEAISALRDFPGGGGFAFLLRGEQYKVS